MRPSPPIPACPAGDDNEATEVEVARLDGTRSSSALSPFDRERRH